MAEMTKVQMPDGTTLQFPSTMSREEMQSAAAGWWANNGGGQPAPTPTPVGPPVAANPDPMLPSPDTDTRSTEQYRRDMGLDTPLIDAEAAMRPQPMRTDGGTPMDIVRSGTSGLARGATELAALPDTLGGGLDAIYERLGLIPAGSRENIPSVGGAIRDAASSLTSGGTGYQPQTTGGEYAQTVGEFAGGGAPVRMAVPGGLLSEAAGQFTEGTAAEPWARAIGGIVGSMAGVPRPQSAPVRNPNSAAGQRAIAANQMRSEGINITKGQQTNNPLLRRMEGTLDAPDIQPEQFTRAIMRRLGSQSDVATPQALASVQDDIVKQMDDAVRGVDIAPNVRQAAMADDVASSYLSNVETGQAVPRVKEIATEIASRSRSARPVSLSDVRTWRQDIGNLTVSSNNATRRAAQELRRILDDMTDTALTAAGRSEDVRKLADARRTYRDFIAVRDASTRSGEAVVGTLSPAQLNQSMIRVMGRENYGVGRTTPASDFTRSAAAVMKGAPTVNSGGGRFVEQLPMVLGGAAGFQYGGVPGLMAGAAAPLAGQMAMRSGPAQALMTSPNTVFGQLSRTTPGLLAQE